MERLEISKIEREFFVDRVWTEEGRSGETRKNLSVHKNIDDALAEKRKYYERKAEGVGYEP